MNLHLKFHNWALNGETKFLVHLQKDSTFQALHSLILQKFPLRSLKIKYKGYNVLLDNKISDVLEYKKDSPQIDSRIDIFANDFIEEEQPRKLIKPNEATNIVVNKPQAQPKNIIQQKQVKQVQVRQQVSDSSDESEVPIRPVKKPVPAPVAQQESSSESDEDSVDMVQKKPATVPNPIRVSNKQNALKLKIPTPLEEFQKKKLTWPSQQKKPIPETKPTQYTPRPDAIRPVQTVQTAQPQSQYQQTKSTTQEIAQSNFVKVTNEQLNEIQEQLKPQERIKFQYIFLDLSTCQPSVSSLLLGKVIKNDPQQKKIQIHKDCDNESLTLSYNEISELHRAESKAQVNQIVSEPPQSEQQQKQSKFLQMHDDQFRMIGKQVNHYYSDRNYPKDDFIQQHSNNEDKSMPIRLLLNFPKIKRVLDSEAKLVEILQQYTNEFQDATFSLIEHDNVWYVKKR